MYARMCCDWCILAVLSQVHSIQPHDLKLSCQNTQGVPITSLRGSGAKLCALDVCQKFLSWWLSQKLLGTAANRRSGTAVAPCGVSCVGSRDTCRTVGCKTEWSSRCWPCGHRETVISTPTAHTFFPCALCQRACPSLLSRLIFILQSSCHALTSRTRVAQGPSTTWSFAYLCLAQNRHISSRNVIRYTSLEHYTYTWHVRSFTDTTYLAFLGSFSRWASTLRRSTSTWAWFIGGTTIPHRLWAQGSQALHRRQASLWIPGSCRTRGFRCQTTILPSTEHSFDLRFCGERRDTSSRLGHGRWPDSCSTNFAPLYLQEREANAERSQVYHSERENLMPSSSQDPIDTGKFVALFSSKKCWIQKRFLMEKIFPQDINRFWETLNLC